MASTGAEGALEAAEEHGEHDDDAPDEAAMEHRRKHAAFATGKAFMWHRRLVQKEDGEWVYEACGHEAGDKNRISDSRVHRYSRERDFVRPDQAEVATRTMRLARRC